MRSQARKGERGTTLLEAMVATGVIIIAFMGVMATNKIGVWMNGNARSITRATAIADDLAEQIGLWSYDDPRLQPGSFTDGGDDVANEGDLARTGTVWSGMPKKVVRDGVPFERRWTVTRPDDFDANGVADGARIVVTVSGGNQGRSAVASAVTLYLFKANPAEQNLH